MAVLILLAAGCGFHSVGGGDGSVASDDMGVGVPPGSDLAMVSGGACAAPLLLVGVENLHNGDTGGGRIARFSLTAAAQQQCTTLRGQGLIAPQPLAVAGMLGGVGAATIDGLDFVDPATDTVKWSKPAPQVTGWLPLEAFSILNPQGTPIMAVAYGPAGSNPSTIAEIDAFDATGTSATGAQPWCIQGSGCTLPLSLSILSVTATPTSLTHFFALDAATPAAAMDVDPWATPPTKTQYIGSYQAQLASIYAVVSAGKARIAWLDGTPTGGAIEHATDSGSGPGAIGGPLECTSGCATILHVVP
ncbi:MAG: hypothetical protein LC659_08170, partial [Myxococcales bacterium]|nr:hypothetical protein [Myxococcales bacterium]